MQLDAKVTELEARVGKLEQKVSSVEEKMSHIYPAWHGDGTLQNPGVPSRLLLIEHRSLSVKEAKTLNYTMIGTWATLGTLILGLLALILDKIF